MRQRGKTMADDRDSERSLPDIESARNLLRLLETGDSDGAERLLEEWITLRETPLFQRVGEITRDIHESLNNFSLDDRLSQLADEDIPDAKERLSYVIEMTDQSAHRTLTAVETCLPIAESIEQRGNQLLGEWERFRNRQLSIDEFKVLTQNISDFFASVAQGSSSMRNELSDVMLAQDFQDLTGQIIRRVINLVQEVEDKLVDLVRVAGGRIQPTAENAAAGGARKGEGPMPPKLAGEDRVANQDDVDDLLSSLGF